MGEVRKRLMFAICCGEGMSVWQMSLVCQKLVMTGWPGTSNAKGRLAIILLQHTDAQYQSISSRISQLPLETVSIQMLYYQSFRYRSLLLGRVFSDYLMARTNQQARSCLQTGQFTFFTHQESRQELWKVCQQGVFLTDSFCSSSCRQMGHSILSLLAWNLNLGRYSSKQSMLLSCQVWAFVAADSAGTRLLLKMATIIDPKKESNNSTITETAKQYDIQIPNETFCQTAIFRGRSAAQLWMPMMSRQLSPLRCVQKQNSGKVTMLQFCQNYRQSGGIKVLVALKWVSKPVSPQKQSVSGCRSYSQMLIDMRMNLFFSTGVMQKQLMLLPLSRQVCAESESATAEMLQEPMKPSSHRHTRVLQFEFQGQFESESQVWQMQRAVRKREGRTASAMRQDSIDKAQSYYKQRGWQIMRGPKDTQPFRGDCWAYLLANAINRTLFLSLQALLDLERQM